MASSNPGNDLSDEMTSNDFKLEILDNQQKPLISKASALKSEGSVKDGPVFAEKSFLTRLKNEIQPWLSALVEFFQRSEKFIETTDEKLFDYGLEQIVNVLFDNEMARLDQEPTRKDIKKFQRSIMKNNMADISDLLMEPSIAEHVDTICGIFTDKVKGRGLLVDEACSLIWETMNQYSLDPMYEN